MLNKKALAITLLAITTLVVSGCASEDIKDTSVDTGTDKVIQVDVENAETKEEVVTSSNNAVDYTLASANLVIEKVEGLQIEVNSSSTSEAAEILINFEGFEPSQPFSAWAETLGFASIVPVSQMEARLGKATTHNYNNDITEYVAFHSSTQCAKLLKGDFEDIKVGEKDAWLGKRMDHCTFGPEYQDNPRNVEMNMMGYEENGYIVVLRMNGDDDKIPENVDELLLSVANAITIEQGEEV